MITFVLSLKENCDNGTKERNLMTQSECNLDQFIKKNNQRLSLVTSLGGRSKNNLLNAPDERKMQQATTELESHGETNEKQN